MNAPADRPVIFMAHAGAELYGADRVFLESVRALMAHGMQVVVTLPCRGPLVSLMHDAGAQVFISPTVVLRKSLLTPQGLLRLAGGAFVGFLRGARLLLDVRPDAIYVNTVTIPLWPIVGKILGIPVLVHVHEAERTAARPLRKALALPLLCASSIVCNSGYSAIALLEVLPRLTSRTKVVANGIPGPEQVTPARTVLDSPLRLLYVGRLSERKGVHLAIVAVALARDQGLAVTLDIVGAVFPGNEAYLAALQEQVVEAGLDGLVHFQGFDPQVWSWFANSDVVIVPSAADEPFGDTAVEAVLAARAAIVSQTPGLTEAAGDYPSVQLVQVGDTANIAAALKSVHDNWKYISQQAATDALAAAAKHSPDGYGERIHDQVLQLLPRARHKK